MKQREELQNNKKLNGQKRILTHEERMKIMTYPVYLQPSILKAAENSQDSIEEIWEEIKVWEDLL
jgi:hypothetical protein